MKLVYLVIHAFFTQLVYTKSNTQAIIVSSSRFWNNYRHSSNALALYHVLKKHKISDIVLFLAHDYTCDCRNVEAGSQFYDLQRSLDLAGRNYPEINYISDSVNPRTFMRLIAGEHSPFLPRSMRLKTTADPGNLLVFFTGHSGLGFMKFQDLLELPADVLNEHFQKMARKRRFDRTLWISDTCKAAALHDAVEIGSFHAISSSSDSESSYAFQADTETGALTADRFSHYSTRFLLQKLKDSPTLGEYRAVLTPDRLGSTATVKNPEDVSLKLDDFMTGNAGEATPVKWTRLSLGNDSGSLEWVSKRISIYDKYMRPPQVVEVHVPSITIYVRIALSILLLGAFLGTISVA